jgi:sugar/nucleoside kinase (ribokinase family)
VLAGATIPGLRTREALLLVERGGERTVLESTSPQVQPALPKAALKRTRALHVDGTWPEVALALVEEARALGVWVSLDLDRADEGGRALVAASDVVVLGRGVAQGFTGAATRADALRALAKDAPDGALLVETLGDEGALAFIGGDVVRVNPFIETILDTTACGDTFRGALLVALLEGQATRDALRFASAAAALKCRDVGRRGCPRRADVDALVAR